MALISLMSSHRTRSAVLAGAAVLSVGAIALSAGAASAAGVGPSSTPATATGYMVAPYVDMSNSQESLLNTAITGKALKAFTAAFVIGEGCNQIWGDTEPIGHDPYIDPEIAKAKSEGASVIISSGGAAGDALAWTCTTQSSVTAGYMAIVKDYAITHLDFDIEGAAIADTASIARNMTALAAVQKSDPAVKVSLTMPVLPTGLTSDGVAVLQAAKTAGAKISIVNIMTMDYYEGTSQNMGADAIAAAKATLKQMKSVNSAYTYANLGITPMIGVNDDGSTFSLANANSVVSWARTNHVGRLSFWAVTRDQACAAGSLPNKLPGWGVTPFASSTCSGVSQSQLQFTGDFVAF